MKAFLSKASKKERIGLSIAIVILSLALFDRLIVSPIAAKIRQLNQQILTDEKQLGQYLRYLQQKAAVSAEYQKYTQYVKKVGSDEEEQTKILGEIEELARRSNISILNMKPQSPKETTFYKKYEIGIEADGAMESLVNFLYQINSSSQLLRAEKVRFSLKEKDSSVIRSSIVVTKVVIP